jgi:hypothetical protein
MVADVGADVEGQVAGAEELAVVPVEGARAPRLSEEDRKRAGEAERAHEPIGRPVPPFEIGRRH